MRGANLDLKYYESRGHKEDYLCVPADWEQSDWLQGRKHEGFNAQNY